METAQNNAGGQAQQTEQTKLNVILVELEKKEKQEWEWLKRCKENYGTQSFQYDKALASWCQWVVAYELIKDIIND